MNSSFLFTEIASCVSFHHQTIQVYWWCHIYTGITCYIHGENREKPGRIERTREKWENRENWENRMENLENRVDWENWKNRVENLENREDRENRGTQRTERTCGQFGEVAKLKSYPQKRYATVEFVERVRNVFYSMTDFDYVANTLCIQVLYASMCSRVA